MKTTLKFLELTSNYVQPVRDQNWSASAENRYHARPTPVPHQHQYCLPALRPHLLVRALYRARCKFLIGYIYVKMILTAKHVTISWHISPLCTFKPFISHNRIYRNRKKNFIGCLSCRIMTLIDKTPFISRFFDILYNFQLVFYTKMWHSDRIQRCDVIVSSEAFGCFRNVSGKFKIYTFQTLINKLLLTEKFRKTFCMQKWPPNFISSSQKKCANSELSAPPNHQLYPRRGKLLFPYFPNFVQSKSTLSLRPTLWVLHQLYFEIENLSHLLNLMCNV